MHKWARIVRLVVTGAVLIAGMRGFGGATVQASESGPTGATGRAATQAPAVKACRVAVFDGEVKAGQAFERPLGGGLKVLLEPIASGWILRVVPAEGPRGEHDYAELATPPYRSVSPLLIGTDFSFRAQDALAWNPRHFRFATDRATFDALRAAYQEDERSAVSGRANDRSDPARAAELRLAALIGRTSEAELTILDAHLVQGSADQARMAAMVASHLSMSDHYVDQPQDGRPTPLGRLNSLRFQLRMTLPKGFRANPALTLEHVACV